MSEFLDINSISIVYNGDVLVQAPNTYKAFLESLRNKEGISNKELAKRTIWCGDFPILNRNDYIEQLKKNGKGVLEYIDGTKYEGEFKDDLYNGYGSIIFSNGNKYEGEFKNGVIKGKGKFIWSDGKKYEGEYNDFII